MTIEGIIDMERWLLSSQTDVYDMYRQAHNRSLDRIELAVGDRIKALEKRVDGYERLLDEAYDGYLSGCTGDELHDLLKGLLEYAPRRNWGEK